MPDKVRIILVWHGGKMIEKSNITKRGSKFALLVMFSISDKSYGRSPACLLVNYVV